MTCGKDYGRDEFGNKLKTGRSLMVTQAGTVDFEATEPKTGKKKEQRGTVQIRVEREVSELFTTFCKDRGLVLHFHATKAIMELMERELEKEKEE